MDAEATPRIPDFALLAKIGQGSYGEVWLAQGVTGVFRAVKVVKRSSFAHERPFEREFQGVTEFAKVAGSEPSQLAILHAGWGLDLSHFYYVMELADDALSGRVIDPKNYVPLTLAEMAKREGRLGAHKVLELGQALARSLATLHRNALVHRDVKPSNVVIVGGVPKLADIGLVARADEARTFVGTERYAAPEGPGSPKADVFGACKVLRELWAGTEQVGEESETIPADLGSESSELAEVLRRGCSLNPAERQKDGQALLEDLLLLQAGKSVKRLRQAERNSKRLKTMLRVGLVVGAIAAVAALGAIQFERLRTRAEVAKRKEAEAERDRIAARSLYASEIGQVERDLAANDLGSARRHLNLAVPERDSFAVRGFEWSLYAKLAKGNQTQTLIESGPVIDQVCLSERGSWLGVVRGGRVVERIEIASGHLTKVCETGKRILEMHENGDLVVELSGGLLVMYGANGSEETLIRTRNEEAVCGRIGGNSWLVADVNNVAPAKLVPQGTSGVPVGIFDALDLSGWSYYRNRLPSIWSGRYVGVLLLRGIFEQAKWRVVVVDGETGLPCFDSVFDDAVDDFQVNEKGRVAVRFPSRHKVSEYSLSTGKPAAEVSYESTLTGPLFFREQTASWIGLSREGAIIELGGSGSVDRTLGTGMDREGAILAMDPYGKIAIGADASGGCRLWDLGKVDNDKNPKIKVPPGGGLMMSLDSAASILCFQSARGTLAALRLTDGSLLHEWSGEEFPLSIAATESLVLSGNDSGEVAAYNLEFPYREVWRTKVSTNPVWNSASSKQGGLLAVTDATGVVSLISISSGTVIRQITACKGTVVGVVMDPLGLKLYTVGLEGILKKWDITTGNMENSANIEPVTMLAFSRDGSHLAALSLKGRNEMILMDPHALVTKARFRAKATNVYCVDFSPAGDRLVYSSDSSRMGVVRTDTGEEVASLDSKFLCCSAPKRIRSIAGFEFARDGNTIVGISSDGDVLRADW